MIPEIHIEEYNYPLPDERIAKYPLDKRDSSKLLCYRDGKVSEYKFTSLPDLLEEGSMMVFNDTKVVPARLHFQRPTGAHIEVFCLEPVDPAEYVSMFAQPRSCRWKSSWACIRRSIPTWKPCGMRCCGSICRSPLSRACARWPWRS